MSRRPTVGTRVRVIDSVVLPARRLGAGKVVAHGRDRAGSYCEIQFDNGQRATFHASALERDCDCSPEVKAAGVHSSHCPRVGSNGRDA